MSVRKPAHDLIRIRLPYRDEIQFLWQEAELLGRLGAFLPGIERPSGSAVAFELGLLDGKSVLRGEGRVLGHVTSDRGERGTVIRFTRLDGSSDALVQRAIRLLVTRAERRKAERIQMEKGASASDCTTVEALSEDSETSAREPTIALIPEPQSTTSSGARRESEATSGSSPDGAAPPVAEWSSEEFVERLRNSGRGRLKNVAPPPLTHFAEGLNAYRPSKTQEEQMEKKEMEKNNNSLYLVAGSKGGVGKSMVTTALVDLLREQGKQVFLIECDNSNPDVWRAHKDEIRTELVNLDEADGWIRLLNICDTNRDHDVVVNTAARNNVAVARFGSTLNDSIGELRRHLTAFWVINRQRDSLDLLREFTTAIPRATLHVVRNGYFGEERKFELYNTSDERKSVEGRGGSSITFADLADRVADDLYSKHLSIANASRTLPLGNRAELSRWRGEVKRAFANVLARRKTDAILSTASAPVA